MAGDIGHENAESMGVQLEKVIEVARDGRHGRYRAAMVTPEIRGMLLRKD
jgi:hypothetical protein